MAKRRSGFTLIELLITITIIGIMASMILFALYGAGEAAKAAKTRSRVVKLSNIIAARYEAYQTRRLPIQIPPGTTDLRLVAKYRLDALRDLMRMEMPDRWTDVIDAPASWTPTPISRPGVTDGYLRKYNPASTHPNINLHEAAECLYMIVMNGVGEDADAREVFRAGDSADTDGDGLPEFIDGWGKPIYWVRWPVGFKSDLVQMPAGTVFDTLDSHHVYPIALSATVRTPDVLTNGDVFSMQPLIYSAGPDGFYGVVRDGSAPIHYADSTFRLNPYRDISPDKIIGTQWVDPATPAPPGAWLDNIHSHAPAAR